jgi:cell division protein FtsL
MASLADLFNPTFLMFLGILVLVVAMLVVYFESKMREQNHKITSMLSLVSTLAEDMTGMKMGLNHLAITSLNGGSQMEIPQIMRDL